MQEWQTACAELWKTNEILVLAAIRDMAGKRSEFRPVLADASVLSRRKRRLPRAT